VVYVTVGNGLDHTHVRLNLKTNGVFFEALVRKIVGDVVITIRKNDSCSRLSKAVIDQ